MKEIIDKILEIELDFFKRTNNTDGVAECQLDFEEFLIMRSSQWESFDVKTNESYLKDLEIAKNDNRNIVQEKYLYMMKNSANDEYEKIKYILLDKPKGHEVLVRQISKIYMDMAKDFYEKYPNFSKHLRPLYKENDTKERCSVETYLMGELMSYSLITLVHLFDYIKILKENNENIIYIINTKVAEKKGMESIENVEKYLF